MKINIQIDSRDLEMIIIMIKTNDPIGFFAGKLRHDLTSQLQSQVKNTDRFVEGEQVEIKQIKNN